MIGVHQIVVLKTAINDQFIYCPPHVQPGLDSQRCAAITTRAEKCATSHVLVFSFGTLVLNRESRKVADSSGRK